MSMTDSGRRAALEDFYSQPWFPGMGDGGTPPPDPDPTIGTLTPNTGSAGAGPISVAVAGTNFAAGSTVEVDGTAVPTAYVSATALTATYDPPTVGIKQFTVRNTTGMESNSVPFTVSTLVEEEPTAEPSPEPTVEPTTVDETGGAAAADPSPPGDTGGGGTTPRKRRAQR